MNDIERRILNLEKMCCALIVLIEDDLPSGGQSIHLLLEDYWNAENEGNFEGAWSRFDPPFIDKSEATE